MPVGPALLALPTLPEADKGLAPEPAVLWVWKHPKHLEGQLLTGQIRGVWGHLQPRRQTLPAGKTQWGGTGSDDRQLPGGTDGHFYCRTYTAQVAVMCHLSQSPDHSPKRELVMSVAPCDKAKVQRSPSTSAAQDIGVRGRVKPWPAAPRTFLTTALSCIPEKKITLS